MAGPAPETAAARLAVREALADLDPGALVLVACSGGADSLALALATAFVAERAGLRAAAVCVDHRLREHSADEAARVAATCRELGLDPALTRAVRSDELAGRGGPEGAARSARYRVLEETAAELGAAAVLLGHTLDDQAETVLLGLARGSGARSLAGMRARTGLWRRPLLTLRRSDTEAVCRAAGLEWVRDPTNAADGPWRTADGGPLRRAAVRDRVMPALTEALGPGVPEALARTADQLRRDADHLDAEAAELLAASRAGEPSTAEPSMVAEIVLDIETLAAAHAALRSRALHTAALASGCAPGALAAVHVEALDALVTRYRGQGEVALPGGVAAVRDCGRLRFLRG